MIPCGSVQSGNGKSAPLLASRDLVQRDAPGLLPHHGLKMVLGAHWTSHEPHMSSWPPRRTLKVVWACLPRDERMVSA